MAGIAGTASDAGRTGNSRLIFRLLGLLPANADLTCRRPVWEALSDIYLDTDVALSRTWRAQVLAESKYCLDELEEILVREVHPVC